jgi:hypothetical protein
MHAVRKVCNVQILGRVHLEHRWLSGQSKKQAVRKVPNAKPVE